LITQAKNKVFRSFGTWRFVTGLVFPDV